MQKEIKPTKNKIPKITEEEYLQYVAALKEREDAPKNLAADMQISPSQKPNQ